MDGCLQCNYFPCCSVFSNCFPLLIHVSCISFIKNTNFISHPDPQMYKYLVELTPDCCIYFVDPGHYMSFLMCFMVFNFGRLAWRCGLFCCYWQQFKHFQLVWLAGTYKELPSCSLGRHLPRQKRFCKIQMNFLIILWVWVSQKHLPWC